MVELVDHKPGRVALRELLEGVREPWTPERLAFVCARITDQARKRPALVLTRSPDRGLVDLGRLRVVARQIAQHGCPGWVPARRHGAGYRWTRGRGPRCRRDRGLRVLGRASPAADERQRAQHENHQQQSEKRRHQPRRRVAGCVSCR